MEISWLIIGILIAVAVILLKFKEVRHRTGLFTIIVILLFFVVTISYVSRVNDINLNSFEGISAISKIYFSWLGNVGKNLWSITGYAIKQDWSINATEQKNISFGKLGK